MKMNIKNIFSVALSLASIFGGVVGLTYFEGQFATNVEAYGSILSWGWIVVGVLQLSIVCVELATGLGRVLFFVVTVLLGAVPFTGLVAIALRLDASWPIIIIGSCWLALLLAYLLAFVGILKSRAKKC